MYVSMYKDDSAHLRACLGFRFLELDGYSPGHSMSCYGKMLRLFPETLVLSSASLALLAFGTV